MGAAGALSQQIDQRLVDRYGPSILLTPPGGWSDLLWIIPVAAGALAVGVIAVVFWRRSRELGSWIRRQPEADPAP